MGHLRAIMSHLGDLMLPRWAQDGAKFSYVRAMIKVGPSWAMLRHVGAIWGHVKAMLKHFRTMLGPFVAI
eukprot:9369920-Karenia_brevis.AAC.1